MIVNVFLIISLPLFLNLSSFFSFSLLSFLLTLNMVRGGEVGVRSIWWNVEKGRQDLINDIKGIKMMNKF